MVCCCSLAGSKACENCRQNMGEYNYVGFQPIVDFTSNYLTPEIESLEKILKRLKCGTDGNV